jgi:hypothetical protein
MQYIIATKEYTLITIELALTLKKNYSLCVYCLCAMSCM